MRTTHAMIAILCLASSMALSCSFLTEKRGDTNHGNAARDEDIARQIAGSWKLSAVNCDPNGNNCDWYTGSRVFGFTKSAEVIVDENKCGSYRIEGSTCRIQTGTREYTVSIIQIDASRLITGEPGRTTTEIFKRIK